MRAIACRVLSWLMPVLIASPAHAQGAGTAAPCETCLVEKVARCGGFLEGATVNRAGNLWLIDVTADRILEVGPSGECILRGKTGGLPNGAKFHRDGTLFIADRDRGLLTFDPRTSQVSPAGITFEGKPLLGLNDLAFDSRGGLYVTVPGSFSVLNPSGRVYYIAPGKTEATLVADRLAFPNGVAVAADDQSLFVSEFTAKRILSLPSATSKAPIPISYVWAHTAGGIGIDGLGIDSTARLYGANFGTRNVLLFSRDAEPLGAISLPPEAGNMVTNLVLSGGHLYITEAQKGEIWRVRVDARTQHPH